ncbi:MAG: phosphonoacetaldehyde reductase, partial [Desulfovibrionales bacterium]|nr:phosphonoacetaldehyde reductase [Desulfovibrionales bacterium]
LFYWKWTMEQKIYNGIGSIGELSRIFGQGSFKRIFLVTGRASYENCGVARAVEEQLDRADLAWTRFSDFAVNPSLEDARRGVEAFETFNPDLVVALGGGSVLDMAKLIKTLAPHREDSFDKIVKHCRVTRSSLPMVAVPTTAGSGSEATHFAVVYVEKQKFSLAHGSLLPQWVILDPRFLLGSSPRQMACSGMDALSQAVESFWNRAATQGSRDLAVRAMELILPAIEGAVLDPNPRGNLAAMLQGSHLAGRAINMTKTTAPHALSYALTTHHGIPHGHAVALILGKFFQINWERASGEDRKGLEVLHGLLGGKNAHDCQGIWYALMEKIGLATEMEALGLTRAGVVDAIVDQVNLERLANHPVALKRGDLVRVFQG